MLRIEGAKDKLNIYPFSPFDFDTDLDFTPRFDSIALLMASFKMI